jgi:hypothetical protein
MNNNLKEIVADLVHTIWARWMIYLFEQCYIRGNGDCVIPEKFVKRWQRQIRTPYEDLPEFEKESDRKITEEYINLFNDYNKEDIDIYKMKLGETIKKKIIPEYTTFVHRVHKGWIYTNIKTNDNRIITNIFVPKDN